MPRLVPARVFGPVPRLDGVRRQAFDLIKRGREAQSGDDACLPQAIEVVGEREVVTARRERGFQRLLHGLLSVEADVRVGHQRGVEE